MIGKLTLDQLRVLVTIADTGSFSAAGRKLLRAQSAISQAMATLEAIHNVALFDRVGHRPTLTEAGRMLLVQARSVLAGADRFEAIAAATHAGLESELAVAIDPLVPTTAFIDSLKALKIAFPLLPLAFSTDGLGGAERRVRSSDAALAFCTLLPSVPDDIAALPLLAISLCPVVAPTHPLALLGRSATRADLEEHIQLVLSDSSTRSGPSYGVMSSKTWRFVELGLRMDFLLAGLGWCRMPAQVAQPFLADGRLVSLPIEDDPERAMGALTIYAAHMRDRPLGRAGAWLLADLKTRLA